MKILPLIISTLCLAVQASSVQFLVEDSGVAANATVTEPQSEVEIQFAKEPYQFIIGVVTMGVLICLSNAGGLSGAGSIIPLMLICFDMDMKKAVPCSASVAVISTLLRFILNYNVKHPHDATRVALDYEVVKLVMPAVFLGSMVGVRLGNKIGSNWQIIIFGTTVTWSIYTSGKKAYQMYLKEKKAEENKNEDFEQMMDTEADKAEEAPLVSVEASTPELAAIQHQEQQHFTMRRGFYILVNFAALFITSFYGNDKNESIPQWGKYTVIAGYTMFCLLVTSWALFDSLYNFKVKTDNAYNFHPDDIQFTEGKDVIKLCFFCGIAAVLCGMTGIAGGMVLGPLFLSYNMIPQVMSNTNQFITMVASLSVTVQFIMKGQIHKDYCIMFGSLALVSAFFGLFFVNAYIKKTGKQSLIAIILTFVLVIALALLPLNYYIQTKESTKDKH